MNDWQPTMNLRFVSREVYGEPRSYRVRILQQQWMSDCSDYEKPLYEWRDVPEVSDEQAPELKPCPFCASDTPELRYDKDGDDWAVMCYRCGVHSNWEFTRQNALYAWNRRAEVAQIPNELIGQLRNSLDEAGMSEQTPEIIYISDEWGTANLRDGKKYDYGEWIGESFYWSGRNIPYRRADIAWLPKDLVAESHKLVDEFDTRSGDVAIFVGLLSNILARLGK